MGNVSDSIFMLSDASKSINSRIISLTRSLILAYLKYSVDGLQYRELKAVLGISDGKLISNLRQLKILGYIDKKEVILGSKKLDFYFLTEQGKKELNKLSEWMKLITKVSEDNVTRR